MNKFIAILGALAGVMALAGVITLVVAYNTQVSAWQIGEPFAAIITGYVLVAFAVLTAIITLAAAAIVSEMKSSTRSINEAGVRHEFLRQIRDGSSGTST